MIDTADGWHPSGMVRLRRCQPLILALALAPLVGCDKDEAEPGDGVADAGDPSDSSEDPEDATETGDPGSGEDELGLDLGGVGPESCTTVNEARECDDGVGQQFCAEQTVDGVAELVWSECRSDWECMPGETSSCGGDERPVTCTLYAGEPYWPECPFTPLVLSFDAGPIELAASTALFDVAGAGECLDSDWPAANNPWLAIDLDRNGFIDAGHELFGSGTVLASGRRADQGFTALAELDSNADGVLDANDERFAELVVWRDEDADKLSMAWELSSLADEGVARIELDYRVDPRCDARGNCGRERSRFEFVRAGQRGVGEVVDVHLACP